jgi:hypothetical protein
MLNNTQITPPRVPIVDQRTGAVSREWYRWFFNQYTVTGGGTGITPTTNGGTGLSATPTNGQLLIGNGTGYALNTLTASSGITITNAAGTISIASSGVVSFSGGTTGLTPATATTGAVTLAGTLGVSNGGSGAVTLTGYVKGNATAAFTASATIPNTDITGLGTISVKNIGASGSFTTVDLKTVTVTDGIITSIV